MTKEGMLSGYRALDLTDDKGFLTGKLLGDLGVTVIKIEKPGGDASRNIGPYYKDEVDPEKSLHWFAYNMNKKGISLNIETNEGQEILKKLVITSDLLIESFPCGYMDSLGLGYAHLKNINPRLVMISITPFGQTGPYSKYKISDLVAWAMSGQMMSQVSANDKDRPPVRISHHSQAYLHAGVTGATGALSALYYRSTTGVGQHVDVSIRDSVARLSLGMISSYDFSYDLEKLLPQSSSYRLPWLWPCKDGYLLWVYFGGSKAKRWTMPLIEWMESENMTNSFIKNFDFENIDLRSLTPEVKKNIEDPTRRFFMSHTKSEILEGAIKHHVMVYPVSTTADILSCIQLAARGYWVKLGHPELNTEIIYSGNFIHSTESFSKFFRRAPMIGEHNQEIYGNELGIPNNTLHKLKKDNII